MHLDLSKGSSSSLTSRAEAADSELLRSLFTPLVELGVLPAFDIDISLVFIVGIVTGVVGVPAGLIAQRLQKNETK